VYQLATERARREHIPAVIHVSEMTQPQGHSTSGSHERYKSKERLRFEIEFDPIRRMREWIIREEIADVATLDELERELRTEVERTREEAWDAYQAPIRAEREQALRSSRPSPRTIRPTSMPSLKSCGPPSRRAGVSSRRRRAALSLHFAGVRDPLAMSSPPSSSRTRNGTTSSSTRTY